MSIAITISGTTYNYPVEGTDPLWGTEASDAFVALVALVNGIAGTGSINPTSFSVSGSQVTFADITGCVFDTSVIRAAIIEYSISRTSETRFEEGELKLIYNGTTWDFARDFIGNGGLDFNVTTTGRVQYKTVAGSSNGILKFRARALAQT